MKILVDIGHPGHVHLFCEPIRCWREHGHQVTIVARDIPVARRLLDAAGLAYSVVSRQRHGGVGQGIELVEHTLRLFPRLLRDRIDVTVSVGGTYTVFAAFLARRPRIVLTDTETARFANRITFPFATAILTPHFYPHDLGKRHVKYTGSHEWCYLHPAYFRPMPEILARYGLGTNEPYSVLRLGAWRAAHDRGVSRHGLEEHLEIVRRLESFGRVLLVPEAELPQRLQSMTIDVRPEDFHQILAHAFCCVTEGATTAMEACLLGTPALYTNSIQPAYIRLLNEQGLLGLLPPGAPMEAAFDRLMVLANNREAHARHCRRVVGDWDDVVTFLVGFIEALVLPEATRGPHE